MQTLPPLPEGIRPLTGPEADRIQSRSKWNDPDSYCETCGGQRKFKARGPGDSIVEFECNCVEQWALYRYLLHSGLGMSHQRIAWRDVAETVPDSVLLKIAEYSQNIDAFARAGFGLVFHGPNGTGKSMLAVLLLKDFIARGYDGYFIQFQELLDAYTRGWGNSDEGQWFESRVVHSRILVIDEVGKESKGRSNVVDSLFDHVIRSRSENDYPTIITTNSSVEDLKTAYGPAIASLLAGKADFVEVTGKDYRETDRLNRAEEIRTGIVRPIVAETGAWG